MMSLLLFLLYLWPRASGTEHPFSIRPHPHHSRHHYSFAMVTNASTVNTATWYLVRGNIAREIPDEETLAFFKGAGDKVIELSMTNFTLAYDISTPLNSRKKFGGDPDSILAAALLKIESLEPYPPVVPWDVIYLGSYINPSVVLWNGRLLLVTGYSWEVGKRSGSRAAITETIEFLWVNYSSTYPFYSKENFLGIPSSSAVNDNQNTAVLPLVTVTSNAQNSSPPSTNSRLLGQDPRVLVVSPDSLIITYTNVHLHTVRMGIAEVKVNRDKNEAFAFHANIFGVLHPPAATNKGHVSEKNWVPFLYNYSSLFFLQSINPLHVVDTKDRRMESGEIFTTTVSLAPKIETIRWDYGAIRGGTPALLIDSVYMAFFHSSRQLDGNPMRTYWMGAYTFTPHPPFKLVGISSFPIIHKPFYDGAWDHISARRIDYCVFPMSFFIDDTDSISKNKTIVLSLGRNDREGWILRLDLNTLLNSLDPV